jgi:hypothetical protein
MEGERVAQEDLRTLSLPLWEKLQEQMRWSRESPSSDSQARCSMSPCDEPDSRNGLLRSLLMLSGVDLPKKGFRPAETAWQAVALAYWMRSHRIHGRSYSLSETLQLEASLGTLDSL